MAYRLKNTALAAAAVLLLMIAPALAQQKFGFVNTYQVLTDTQEGKARIAKWDVFVKARAAEIETESKQLEQLQQQYADQQASLNAETLADLQNSIEQKTTGLKRKQEDSNRDAERRRNEILQDMSKKIRDLLSEYGEQNGYSAIFLRNPDQQIFVASALDLTAEVVKLYDTKFPVAAGGPN